MPNEKDPSTTNGAAPTEGATEQQQPKFMTADDFNGAMTARERRFEQRMAKLLDERLAAVAPAKQSDAAQGDDAETAEGETGKVQPSPSDLAYKKIMAKLNATQRQMAAEKEAAAKEKAELLERQGKADVIAALTSAGSVNAKGAYAALKEDGRIKRNANGELVVTFTRDWGEDEVKLESGIKEWLSTEEGKHYQPARGGGEGSGTVIRGGGQRGGAPLSKEEARKEAQRALTSFVLGGR